MYWSKYTTGTAYYACENITRAGINPYLYFFSPPGDDEANGLLAELITIWIVFFLVARNPFWMRVDGEAITAGITN